MINKVAKTIIKYDMLKPNECVIVAVSGGPDSVALLNVLVTLSKEFGITIVMAYLNHCLRGEDSIKEEYFVKQLGKNLGIYLAYKSVDIIFEQKERGKGMSIEEFGRQERYKFLFHTAKKHNAQKIALGHHLNDQTETVMINFIRGSGPEGLKGILPVRADNVIRPLIECTKKEIMDYLKAEGLSFVSDASNAESIYIRNKIRNHLIPEIKRIYNPNIEKGLHKMADIMRLENDFMIRNTEQAMAEMNLDKSSDKFEINIPQLLTYHEAIQNRVMKSILLSLSPSNKGIAYVHIQSFKNIIRGNNTKASVNLPFGIEVRRESDYVSIHYRPRNKAGDQRSIEHRDGNSFHYDINIPGNIKIQEQGISIKVDLIENIISNKYNFTEKKVAYMDYDQIIHPIIIRNMKTGDRIKPLGMNGTQKLKTFFVNEKVPKTIRDIIPLLVDGQSVIWITGMRLSERVKITNKTRKIIRAEIV